MVPVCVVYFAFAKMWEKNWHIFLAWEIEKNITQLCEIPLKRMYTMNEVLAQLKLGSQSQSVSSLETLDTLETDSNESDESKNRKESEQEKKKESEKETEWGWSRMRWRGTKTGTARGRGGSKGDTTVKEKSPSAQQRRGRARGWGRARARGSHTTDSNSASTVISGTVPRTEISAETTWLNVLSWTLNTAPAPAAISGPSGSRTPATQTMTAAVPLPSTPASTIKTSPASSTETSSMTAPMNASTSAPNTDPVFNLGFCLEPSTPHNRKLEPKEIITLHSSVKPATPSAWNKHVATPTDSFCPNDHSAPSSQYIWFLWGGLTFSNKNQKVLCTANWEKKMKSFSHFSGRNCCWNWT